MRGEVYPVMAGAPGIAWRSDLSLFIYGRQRITVTYSQGISPYSASCTCSKAILLRESVSDFYAALAFKSKHCISGYITTLWVKERKSTNIYRLAFLKNYKFIKVNPSFQRNLWLHCEKVETLLLMVGNLIGRSIASVTDGGLAAQER